MKIERSIIPQCRASSSTECTPQFKTSELKCRRWMACELYSRGQTTVQLLAWGEVANLYDGKHCAVITKRVLSE
jgi:hypothetical protein